MSGLLQKTVTANSMVKLTLSRKAETDLAEIAEFTIGKFGIEQARRYRDSFGGCFNSLCDNPRLGRSADELASGLRRIRQQAHTIFYIPTSDQILIVRVLHHSRDFRRQF